MTVQPVGGGGTHAVTTEPVAEAPSATALTVVGPPSNLAIASPLPTSFFNSIQPVGAVQQAAAASFSPFQGKTGISSILPPFPGVGNLEPTDQSPYPALSPPTWTAPIPMPPIEPIRRTLFDWLDRVLARMRRPPTIPGGR